MGRSKPIAGTTAESYASPNCLPKIQYPTIQARGHKAKTNSRAARMRLPLDSCARGRWGRGSWPKEVIVAMLAPVAAPVVIQSG